MKTKVFYVVMALAMALSLVAVALPAAPAGANGPETLYVCPGEYEDIQEAIDDADPGDTIMVCPGDYHEQLFIDKQLTILSTNGTYETYIDGWDLDYFSWETDGIDVYPTVWLDAAGVVFGDEGQGFTVLGGWPEEPYELELWPALLNLSSGCTIEGNEFGDSQVGILGYYPYSPSNNQVVNNEFYENDVAVWIMENEGDTISGNFFGGNDLAIWLCAGEVHDIDVVDNDLEHNGLGILLAGSHGNTIRDNEIWDTHGAELELTEFHWDLDAVAIELVLSHDNTIEGNDIYEDEHDYYQDYGIRLNGSSNNDILANHIDDCDEDGILLDGGYLHDPFGWLGPSNDNLVQGNEVDDCHVGIHLDGDVNNNRVLGNEVDDCEDGIWVETGECGNEIGRSGEGNTVYDCEIGIHVDYSEDETIAGNTVYDCWVGIMLDGCHRMRVEDNQTWMDVPGEGECGNDKGIVLEDGSSQNTVRDNDISYNDYEGLALGYEGGPANGNFVSANRIHYNGEGIWIDGDDNDICGNDIRYNSRSDRCGMDLAHDAEGNDIHCNNIVDNTEWCGSEPCSWGLYNEGDVPVNAELNWWGDASGPGGVGPGSGDTVGGAVIFSPWLLEELSFPDGAAPNILNTAAVPDMVSLLDTEYLGWTMYDMPYSVGPSYTDLIVDTGCEACETSWVSIDLSALLLGMLPEDIDGVVAGWEQWKQDEWHEWLNCLAHTDMEYVELFDEEAQEPRCFWDCELYLDDLFDGDRWGDWDLDHFFDWEDLMEMVFEEFRLGEFDIPVTAVDCSGNEAHGVVTLAVVDFQLPVEEGWNVRSSPIAVGTTWGKMKSMGEGLMYEAVVMWDAEHGQWVEPSSGSVMAPLQAYYIAVSERDQVGLIISRQATAPPQRQLYVGWNLIGVAPYVNALGRIDIYDTLATVYQVPGGLPGWLVTMSVGDSVDYYEEFWYDGLHLKKPDYWKHFHQDEWITFAADDEWFPMSSGGGYWVFMDNADILGGYSYTPFPSWLLGP